MVTRPRDLRFILGCAATALWLIASGALLISVGLPRAANEWGDFVAGFFSPIAVLWLVVGYLQQREELRNANAALEEERANRKDAARPKFIARHSGTSSGSNGMTYNMQLVNAGNMATNVTLRYEPPLPGNSAQVFDLIPRGQVASFGLNWQQPFECSLRLSYMDADGMPGEVAIPIKSSAAGNLTIGLANVVC